MGLSKLEKIARVKRAKVTFACGNWKNRLVSSASVSKQSSAVALEHHYTRPNLENTILTAPKCWKECRGTRKNDPAVNRHFELEIKTLQNAPTDANNKFQAMHVFMFRNDTEIT